MSSLKYNGWQVKVTSLNYQQKIPFKESSVYMNDFHFTTKVMDWSEETIDHFRELFRTGKMRGAYGKETVDDMAKHMKEHMEHVITGKLSVIRTKKESRLIK